MPPDNNQTAQRSVHGVPETARKAQIRQPAGKIPKKGYPIFELALLALHPAIQNVPEITPAEVVEDLAHNLQLCRLQTQEAHLAAQYSLALATGLRTEVQHLRSQLADLESIVMRELVKDLPLWDLRMKKTKTEHPSRYRRKRFRTRRMPS
jgi:hypothetical protein